MRSSSVAVRAALVAGFILLTLASTTDWVPVQRDAMPPPPVALHHEQTIAVVTLDTLQGANQPSIIRCSLILAEAQDGLDKQEVLLRLGQRMEVREVDLAKMMQLVEECSNEGSREGEVEPKDVEGGVFGLGLLTVKRGIMPGTLWCGVDDIAESYKSLGSHWKVDRCCRAHDHCPVKVKGFRSRYGLQNFSPSTKSHCACDDQFFRCLKEINSQKADTVGKIFFNFLKMQCMEKVFKPTKCTKVVEERRRKEEIETESERRENVGSERQGRHLNLGLAAVLGRSGKKRRCLEWEQEERWQIVDTKQQY